VTKPFRLDGTKLEVNADARGGALAVEVLDDYGKPLAGLSREQCRPLADADGLCLPVTWEGQPGLAAHQGKVVRLKFYLEKAKLYAFQIRP
jgi:hypothetical protein